MTLHICFQPGCLKAEKDTSPKFKVRLMVIFGLTIKISLTFCVDDISFQFENHKNQQFYCKQEDLYQFVVDTFKLTKTFNSRRIV